MNTDDKPYGYKKKLIEVALPLEAVNKETAGEKSIRRHPSTLHLWWSRKPLVACRAVLFASLVDDPSSHPEQFPTEEAQDKERQRLFRIIEELVKWENSNNETVLNAARKEILKSTNGHPPPVLDPFCGGGSIPLEAQRLGLEAHASDLNPVAVLITKALVEIPPKFAGKPPVNPEARKKLDHSRTWRGAEGLAEDVRYYGKWMRDEAEKRIGHLYPKVKLPKEQGGGEATIIAWLWARTVKCPNPACGARMPLATKFWLSVKREKKTWLKPVIHRDQRRLLLEVESGEPDDYTAARNSAGTTFVNEHGKKVKATFRCIFCGAGIAKGEYIDSQANSGEMSCIPWAIVALKSKGRMYIEFDQREADAISLQAGSYLSSIEQSSKLPKEPARGTFASNAQGRAYGFKTFSDYFTSRQLCTLMTLTELVDQVRTRVLRDARSNGVDRVSQISAENEILCQSYADAVATYLGLAVDRIVMTGNSLVRWNPVGEKAQHAFGLQGLPMIWDFAEPNFFASATGGFDAAVELVAEPLSFVGGPPALTSQLEASAAVRRVSRPVICTDPPYYDNVGFSDLSDFFYVWLRRSLSRVYPSLFSTVLTPKDDELSASPYRFEGDHDMARQSFEDRLAKTFTAMNAGQHPEYPLILYYAFKQSETEAEDDESHGIARMASTGWETMLEGLLRAQFVITGTWPLRTEMKTRQVAMGTNALATSIVLVCRPRTADASLATRREFLNALKAELPAALKSLQRGNIAPVDLAQAAIGPGMAVFSRYSKIVEADGSPMTVRTALSLINQTLDEVLAEQEGEFDADTRFAVSWFDQYGFKEGPFGEADVLARAKNTSVNGMVEAGIAKAKAGKVLLLGRKDLAEDWDPASDRRITIWEVAHYLIRLLEDEGESAAASLLRQVGALGDAARDLAYRLYGICERKKWSQEALPYNALVVAWPEIVHLARSVRPTETQARLGL